jgi:4'-phosphopantetheinyl transferase
VLAPREVLVCLANPLALRDPARRAAALSVLTDEERANLGRLRFDRDREVALASRAVQRRTLSRCTDGVIAPEVWRFGLDPHGRPRITAPASTPALTWNVANTLGLVVCAVTFEEAVGIDVEARRADADDAIIDTYFSPEERGALRRLPGPDQPSRFVELWTLKEAYVKARGLGLGLSLERISFDPSTTPPGFTIDPAVDDDPLRWRFEQWWPTRDHCVALCVRSSGSAPIDISVHWDDLG